MEKFFNTNHNVMDIEFACWVAPGTGNAVHKNRPSHGLALNCNGEKLYEFSDGTKYIVKENCFIYLPKYSNYTVISLTPGGTYCINFQMLETDRFNPFVLPIKNANDAVKAYKNAEKAWTRKTEGYDYLCKSELYKILYILKNEHSLPYTPNSKKALIEPAISYIHKHYADSALNVEELSKLCNFSYEYFRRLFHYCYGCSPINYINGLKINRAKELLSSDLYSVSEVAFLSGFSDLSYFSRFFKKTVNISPADYVKQHNINNLP